MLVGGGRWADVSGRWVRGSRWGALIKLRSYSFISLLTNESELLNESQAAEWRQLILSPSVELVTHLSTSRCQYLKKTPLL